MIIAVLGIVNTLALSVIERTREVGLLRAVGMSRRQLRSMIRLESVAISVLGAVLGIGLGLVFGISLQQALSGQGIAVLSIPPCSWWCSSCWPALVGVLAAVCPARRGGADGRAPGDHRQLTDASVGPAWLSRAPRPPAPHAGGKGARRREGRTRTRRRGRPGCAPSGAGSDSMHVRQFSGHRRRRRLTPEMTPSTPGHVNTPDHLRCERRGVASL